MKINVILATIAMTSGISTVNAADIIKSKPLALPAAFSWAGPYLGVETGITFDHFYSTAGSSSNQTVRSIVGRPEKTVLAGIYGGYNLRLGQSAILGVDGNIDLHRPEAHNIIGNEIRFYNFYQETMRSAIRIRLGVAKGKLMPYIAGGLSIVRAGQAAGLLENGIATPSHHQHNYKGWNVGAGADYNIADNIALRFDYRFSKIPVKDYYFVSDNNNWLKHSRNIGLKSHQLRVGAAYKF